MKNRTHPYGTRIAVKIVKAYRCGDSAPVFVFVCQHRDDLADGATLALGTRDLAALAYQPALGQDRVIELREGRSVGGYWMFLDGMEMSRAAPIEDRAEIDRMVSEGGAA